jgi:hypothetical protein
MKSEGVAVVTRLRGVVDRYQHFVHVLPPPTALYPEDGGKLFALTLVSIHHTTQRHIPRHSSFKFFAS